MSRALKLKLNPPATFGRRAWNDNQRQAQGYIARARKPWLSSTGPKTVNGKTRSSRNALKHGHTSELTKRFKRLLRMQRKFLAEFKHRERIERLKCRYVLDILRGRIACPPHLAGCAFMKHHNRHPDESRDPGGADRSGSRLSSG